MFVLIWWTALFGVLAFVSRTNADPDPISGVRGAPTQPFLRRTILVTTAVTCVLWLGVFGIATSGVLSFRNGVLALHGNCAQDVRFCR